VPVRWCTYKPCYEQHVRQCCYTVYKTCYQDYQVPVRWCTYKPCYEQHVCCVPVTCYQTVTEPRQMVYKTYTQEPVWTTQCYKVCTGDWHEERHYCPGPIVTRCCQKPGCWSFDPCTCTSHYCPGPVETYQVQCPGHWVCKKVWCPREETRTMRCCHYVCREQC